MRFLIGLDDTDNPRTGSTGVLAKRLGLRLQETGFGTLEAISRHQLIVSPQVPCTTRNSSICIMFEADAERRSELEIACRAFLLHEYAQGSDTGLALASWNQVTAEVFTWARLAKTRVLKRQDALATARSAGIAIAGLCGSGAGVIGALAAIGLRFRGDDGRVLWLPNMNELLGVYTYIELMDMVPFDRIENLKGRAPLPEDKIEIGEWVRPVIREGRTVLLVEGEKDNPEVQWHTLPGDKVRALSD